MPLENQYVTHVLLQTGADVNQRSDKGSTTLYNRAIYNNTDAIRTLIQYGASNAINSYRGEKPIDIARRMNNGKAVLALQQ